MTKLLLSSILILCLAFCAEAKWREIECIPAEIQEKHVELSPEAKAESKILTDYAMSLFRPDDFEMRSDEEKLEYLEECAQKIHGVLEMYPQSETALKTLMEIRTMPEFKEKALEELTALRARVPDSQNVQTAYLSTLLMTGKLEEAYQELPALLERFPNAPLIILQAAMIYSERNDYEALEKTFEMMDDNHELQKNPAMRILYLGFLYTMGEEESANEYCDSLTDDDEFLEEAMPIYQLAWDQLVKSNAWHAITGLMGSFFLKNFWIINDETRCDLCQKTMVGAIRTNDYESIALILKFITGLENRGLRFRLASTAGDLVNRYTSELMNKMPEAVNANLISLNQALGELCLANLPIGAVPDTACRILSQYHMWGGNSARALELLRMIQKPTQADENQITTLLLQLELFTEALPRLHKMRDEMPEKLTAEFYMQLGIAEDKCGNKEESASAFYKALELNPKFASAANYLGYTILINNGDIAEAERLLEIAINESPENTAIMDSIAWLRYKQGRNGEALRIMSDVVRAIGFTRLTDAENAEIREHLQTILLNMGYDYLASYYN